MWKIDFYLTFNPGTIISLAINSPKNEEVMTDNTPYQGSFCQRKPDITYPCSWEYKVIGTDREKIEETIIAACAPLLPTIVLSNVSSNGRYFSLDATLEVDSEELRLTIFERIQNSPDVKMVI